MKMLRMMITIPFLVLYVVFAIVIAWIYQDFTQRSIEQYEKNFVNEIGLRIQYYLDPYFSLPERIVHLNREMLRGNVQLPDKLQDLGLSFIREMQALPGLTYISFTNDEGEYVGAFQPQESITPLLISAIKEDHMEARYYHITERVELGPIIRTGQRFDARQQTWFKHAELHGEAVWYPVYKYALNSGLGVGVAAPVYDENDLLLGVITADVALSKINDYLSSKQSEFNEIVFLMEPKGELIAVSTADEIYLEQGNQINRILAHESKNELIRAAAQTVLESDVWLTQQVVTVNKEKYWLEKIVYESELGLELILVILIPKRELATILLYPNHVTSILVVIIIFIGVLIGTILARKVSQRINQLKIRIAHRTSELKKANAELIRMTLTDPLTGIPNRRHFDETLKREWARALQLQSPISLVISDIDYFKNYNDTYGHQAGDRVLVHIARLFNELTGRATDLAARYGGEEFILLLPDTDEHQALAWANTFHKKVENEKIPHQASVVSSYVTVSVGAATTIPKQDMDYTALIQEADRQLYQAKSKGRNCVMINRV